MKITYIYHSGFTIELEKHVLIFDYYKGTLPEWDKEKKILFFASHKHHDHFDFTVFDHAEKYPHLHYFFSSDIRLSDKYLERNGVSLLVKEQITYIGKNQMLEWEDIKIETLRSTDEGVAFLVTAEGKNFYHAGDLNWWHWEGEEASWNQQMERDYKKEMERISGRYFDAAFVPLDPRLENASGLGMQTFLDTADAGMIFPMHMWDQYEVIGEFKQSVCGKRYAEKIAEIDRAGQEFIL